MGHCNATPHHSSAALNIFEPYKTKDCSKCSFMSCFCLVTPLPIFSVIDSLFPWGRWDLNPVVTPLNECLLADTSGAVLGNQYFLRLVQLHRSTCCNSVQQRHHPEDGRGRLLPCGKSSLWFCFVWEDMIWNSNYRRSLYLTFFG